MAIKVRDPRRWKRLPQDMALSLDGEGRRPVTLEVHVVGHVQFECLYPDDTVGFLGTVHNAMDRIEFIADGPVEVWALPVNEAEQVKVCFYTDEGRNVAFVNDGKVSFTVPHMRRTESERVMEMQALMLANAKRNEARMAGYIEAYREREAKRRAAEAENSSGAGEAELSAGEGEQDASAAPDAGAESVVGSDAK